MRATPLDLALTLAYLVGMLGLGLYATRFVRNFDDYFVAGRRLGFLLSLGTLSAIFVGGGAIGIAGQGYSIGMGGVWYYWAYALGFLVLALTVLRQVRGQNRYTIADLLYEHFGPGAKLVSSLVIFFSWLCFLAALIVAGARVVEVVFGLPLPLAIFLVAATVVTYTTFGGMWAVAMTDLFQSTLLLLSIGAMFVAALVKLGGWQPAFAALPESFALVAPPGQHQYLWAMVWIIAPTTIVGPDIYLKIWSMKDNRTAHRTVWVLILVIAACAVCLTFLGVAARSLIPGVEPELALPSMVRHLFAPGLSGVVLVSLMAAAVSGAVPQVVVCSSILTRDVYQGWIDPAATPTRLLALARINTLLVGTAGMVLAQWIPNIVELSLHAYRIFVPALVPQVLAAFFLTGVRPRAAVASMVLGPAVTVTAMVTMPGSMLTYWDPVIPGLLAAVAAMTVLSLPGRGG